MDWKVDLENISREEQRKEHNDTEFPRNAFFVSPFPQFPLFWIFSFPIISYNRSLFLRMSALIRSAPKAAAASRIFLRGAFVLRLKLLLPLVSSSVELLLVPSPICSESSRSLLTTTTESRPCVVT